MTALGGKPQRVIPNANIEITHKRTDRAFTVSKTKKHLRNGDRR